MLFDEMRQGAAQIFDIGCTGKQHLAGAGVIEQRQQQVLAGDKFVPLLVRLNKGHMQGYFQFLGNHVNSFFACVGC